MSSDRFEISGYKGMWLFALFDLPVDDKPKKKAYVQFRVALKKQGFTMLQYSVYARFCASEETGVILKKKLVPALPAEGQVRFMMITDKQYGKMDVYFGRKLKPVEDPPMQLSFF